jgi:hypothetical protein
MSPLPSWLLYSFPLRIRDFPDNEKLLYPNGTTSPFFNHGHANLVCTPSSKISIVLFLFTNYLAHCATVNTLPGELTVVTVMSTISALLFPSSGVLKAMNNLIRRPRLYGKNELEMAARAGALCMVVRDQSWIPRNDELLYNVVLPDVEMPKTGKSGMSFCQREVW